MEKTSLESAIRDEAELAISAIAQKEAEELKRLDDAHLAGLEEFQKQLAAATDGRIRQESSKAQNRASLDLQKHKLRSVEAFISSAVEEAEKVIRDQPQYKIFLLAAVMDTIGHISNAAEVRLSREDMVLKDEIQKALKAAHLNMDIAFVEDKTIKWGGYKVVDGRGGRIFDGTIERICYRKSPVIRREIMNLLANHFGEAR